MGNIKRACLCSHVVLISADIVSANGKHESDLQLYSANKAKSRFNVYFAIQCPHRLLRCTPGSEYEEKSAISHVTAAFPSKRFRAYSSLVHFKTWVMPCSCHKNKADLKQQQNCNENNKKMQGEAPQRKFITAVCLCACTLRFFAFFPSLHFALAEASYSINNNCTRAELAYCEKLVKIMMKVDKKNPAAIHCK